MVAIVNYIFGDIQTGAILEEISLTGVSLTTSLSTGDFRGSFQLDQTGKMNETLIAATIPGRCFVVVERNGQIIGDYILKTRTYQSQAKVFELYGGPWKDYPESRIVRTDSSWADHEQMWIMWDLYTQMQQEAGTIQVVIPASFPESGVLKTLDVLASDYKTYRQVIDSIADTNDGFDWLIRTTRQDNTYVRTLEIGFPTIGQHSEENAPTFEYISTPDGPGGNILNYWVNDTMGNGATTFFGMGASDLAVVEVSFMDLIDAGFPRYDKVLSFKDVTDASLLQALTERQAQIMKAPQSVLTLEIKADRSPQYGEYNIGDLCRIVIKDARFPNTLNKITRILGMTYYPPEGSNSELVRLTVEGDNGA